MSWNAGAASDNLTLGVKVNADGGAVELNLKGTMTDSGEGVFIKGGVLDVAAYGETVATLGIEYGIRSISAGDVDIDRSQAADFFSLDMEQFQQDIMAAAMRLSMFE